MHRDTTTLTRRGFLAATAAGATLLALPRLARGDAFTLPEAARSALSASPLVYVSPLRSDGAESVCHGEVWFVADQGDVLLVTAADRWKARAVARGLTRARLWVGDFGVWTRNRGRWSEGPSFAATASFEKDPAAHARALEAFGRKYPDEWGKWGPRFRDGLADGSRVMIRYGASGA